MLVNKDYHNSSLVVMNGGC